MEQVIEKMKSEIRIPKYVKVLCVDRNERFGHHRRLEINKEYFAIYTKDEETISIYSEPNSQRWLGHYPSKLFLDIANERNRKITEILND